MEKVAPETAAVGTSSITFNFTHTKRDEVVQYKSLGGNYILDPYGNLFQNSKHSRSCVVTVVGGDNTFMHDKARQQPASYISTNQVVVLHYILSALAMKTTHAVVNLGNDTILTGIGNSIYDTYRS